MIEMIGLWLKISGRPDGTSKGIWGDLRDMHDDQNQKWHCGRCSASDAPQLHGAEGMCVSMQEGLGADISCPEPSSSSSPVLLELSVSLMELNLVRGNGENRGPES